MRRIAVILGVLATMLVACGPKNEPPPPAAETADASSVALRLALALPDTLQRAVEGWATVRRARVEWIAPGTVEGATLTEIDAGALHALVTDGALRPVSDALLESVYLAEAGRVDGTGYGLAWRADLTALAVDGESTWPALARRGESMLLVSGNETAAFLALAAASGAGLDPGRAHDLDLRSEAGVEALTFLRRLAVRAQTVDAGAAWPDGVDAAVLGSAQRDAVPADFRIVGFPGPESDATPRIVARVRVLVAPTSGDHGDLGLELAGWLADPARASLLHARVGDGIALHRDVTDEGPTGAWLALRGVACLPPTAAVDAVAWNAALDDAVRAAVERRRAPRAALDEAWSRR